jgi:hypothetical protein
MTMEFNLTKIKEFAEKGRAAQAAADELTGAEKNGNNGQALTPVSLDLAIVRPRFDEYLERVSLFEKSAQALEVKDEETREQAANLAGGAKKLIKAIDGRTKEIIGPADGFIKSVRAFAGKFTDRLKSAADLAGKKELRFIELQEMKRREAEKLAQEAAAKLQKQIDKEAKKKGIEPVQVLPPVVPETQTTARTEAGITSFTVKTWDFEIVDDSDVPRLFCSADPKKIREAIKNGAREIRGVRIFEKTEIRHRS